MSSAPKNDEPIFVFLYAAIILVTVAIFLWVVFHGPILEMLRYFRLAQLYLIIPFTNHQLDVCRNWLWHAKVHDIAPSQEIVQLASGCFGDYLALQDHPGDYYGLTGYSIIRVEAMIAPYYHWVWATLFFALTVYVVFFSNKTKFNTKHNLESLIRAQVKMWPVISPIVNFNPIKHSARIPGSRVPDQLPLFAEALTPEEWVSWNKITVTNNIPDREATRRAFIKQLGPRWKDLSDTPPYYRALFAAFALKGAQRREESDDLLGRIALCWSENGGMNIPAELMSEIKKINRNPEIGGLAMDYANQHAYRTTALLGVLRWGRWMGGVLAPGQFVWLRGVDRGLWYPLNNLGRRSFHSEGAGAMAHFMAEQNAKKPLPIPRVDTAIMTLNTYFNPKDGEAPVVPPREGDQSKMGN